jgi:pyruvate/2-oxoglutarate dehydrogenase complex dihydrolipoamide acyltransferase (E2) component
MRQKLNENPVAQIVLVGVMLVVVGFLLVSGMGGGSEESAPESSATPPATEESTAPSETATATEGGAAPVISASTAAVSAPSDRQLPHAVEVAYAEDKTIALLIVRDGGIDDHLVREATQVLEDEPHVALFSAKAKHVARFAQITGPLGVNQTPALIVIRPKHLNGSGPAPASVTYGFQTKSDVRQAIQDAVYRGRKLTYAPS